MAGIAPGHLIATNGFGRLFELGAACFAAGGSGATAAALISAVTPPRWPRMDHCLGVSRPGITR